MQFYLNLNNRYQINSMMYVCFFFFAFEGERHIASCLIASGVKCDGQFLSDLLLGPCASISLADAHQTAATQHFGEDAPVISWLAAKMYNSKVVVDAKSCMSWQMGLGTCGYVDQVSSRSSSNKSASSLHTNTSGLFSIRTGIIQQMWNKTWKIYQTTYQMLTDGPGCDSAWSQSQVVWPWPCAVCTRVPWDPAVSQMIMPTREYLKMQLQWHDTFGIAQWTLFGWHLSCLGQNAWAYLLQVVSFTLYADTDAPKKKWEYGSTTSVSLFSAMTQFQTLNLPWAFDLEPNAVESPDFKLITACPRFIAIGTCWRPVNGIVTSMLWHGLLLVALSTWAILLRTLAEIYDICMLWTI